jgi:cytochrome P450
VSLTDFNPRSAEVHDCPFPWYTVLRDTAPVYQEPHTGWWFVTRYADVVTALRRPGALSSRVGEHLRPPAEPGLAEQIAQIRAAGWPEVPVLVVEDPPAHRRQRVLVQRAFSPARVAAMEPTVRAAIGRLLDDVPAGQRFDFVPAVATPFPLLVIADALQIPPDHWPDFKRWSDNRVRMIGAALTPADKLDIARSEVERQRYFAAAFSERRQAPRDDLLTDLVQARLGGEDDRALSTGELLSIIGQVLAAGNESTTKVLTEITYQLAAHPARWAWLRQDPAGRAAQVADEGLRMACPFQISLRIALEPVTIDGTEIPAGSVVALVLGSASRDDRLFDDPEQFSPDRGNVADHLAFGNGIHRCIGASLARLELTVAVEQLATRFEALDLPDAAAITHEPSFVIRGIQRLPLRARPTQP